LEDRVDKLAFLTPNFTHLAFFRGSFGSWRQKVLFGILAFSYLAFLEAVGTYHQTGVLAF